MPNMKLTMVTITRIRTTDDRRSAISFRHERAPSHIVRTGSPGERAWVLQDVEVDLVGGEKQPAHFGRDFLPETDAGSGHIMALSNARDDRLGRPDALECVDQVAVHRLGPADEVVSDQREPAFMILRPTMRVHLREALARDDADELLEGDRVRYRNTLIPRRFPDLSDQIGGWVEQYLIAVCTGQPGVGIPDKYELEGISPALIQIELLWNRQVVRPGEPVVFLLMAAPDVGVDRQTFDLKKEGLDRGACALRYRLVQIPAGTSVIHVIAARLEPHGIPRLARFHARCHLYRGGPD